MTQSLFSMTNRRGAITSQIDQHLPARNLSKGVRAVHNALHASAITLLSFITLAPLAPAQGQTIVSGQAVTASNAAAEPVTALYQGLKKLESNAGRSAQERVSIMTPVVTAAFDLPLILKNSVGLRYANLAEQEKTALLEAFRRFTVARYVSSFGKGDKVIFKINPKIDSSPYGQGCIIHTTLVGDDSKTELDYIVQKSSNGYQISDILLNGHISQVAAQRADFSSTLSRGGAKALQTLLNDKSRSFLTP